jgi:chorismate mutase
VTEKGSPPVSQQASQQADPVIAEIRAEISENDRAIVAAINRRLELVERIRRHKESRGLPFVDAAREESMLRELQAANAGPLSAEGVAEVHAVLLGLTKRELFGTP